MNSFELTAFVTALANAVAAGLTAEKIGLISAVFVQLGDTLATIATAGELCEGRSQKASTD